MKQWNFYFSGILYGIIRDQNEDGKELNHQTLDVFTNTFNREEPFHNDDFYEVLRSVILYDVLPRRWWR